MLGKPILNCCLFVLSVGVSWQWHSHHPPRRSGCLHLSTTLAFCQARSSEYHRGWNWLYILWDGSSISSAWGFSLQPHHWILCDWSFSWWSELLWSAGSCYNLSSPDTPSMYADSVIIQNLLLSLSLLLWYQNFNPQCTSWNFSAAGTFYQVSTYL